MIHVCYNEGVGGGGLALGFPGNRKPRKGKKSGSES